MPLSIERKRAIAIYGTIVILLAAGVAIIIEYPEVLNPAEKPALQILSRTVVDGRNESEVNASFTVVIQNTGMSNESKTLVCSVSFQTGSSGFLTYDNRTNVTLAPGETKTYYPVIVLPDSAISVNWNLSTAFED